MRIHSRLELIVVYAAILVDKYAYTYSPCAYKENIGEEEICRVRHINSLIEAIASNGKDLLEIIKQIGDDIEFLSFDLSESGNTQAIYQLKDAYEIMQLLTLVS